MNINSLWKAKPKRRGSNYSRSRVSCSNISSSHEAECFRVQRRMEQFDKLLMVEHARIQDHMDELEELRCELKADCNCRSRFEKQLQKMEKRVMKLRAELQDARKSLLDSDCLLQQGDQRHREMQHRLQELWGLITDCLEFKDVDLVNGRNGGPGQVKVVATTASTPTSPVTIMSTPVTQ